MRWTLNRLGLLMNRATLSSRVHCGLNLVIRHLFIEIIAKDGRIVFHSGTHVRQKRQFVASKSDWLR
jgi:hypothetical protein